MLNLIVNPYLNFGHLKKHDGIKNTSSHEIVINLPSMMHWRKSAITQDFYFQNLGIFNAEVSSINI